MKTINLTEVKEIFLLECMGGRCKGVGRGDKGKNITTITILNNDNHPDLIKAHHEIRGNPEYWTLNYGISSNTILAYNLKKQVVGYINFGRYKNTLNASFDVRSDIKNKSSIIRKLYSEFNKEISKMKGLKEFKAEFSTDEGEKASNYISKRFNLKLIEYIRK